MWKTTGVRVPTPSEVRVRRDFSRKGKEWPCPDTGRLLETVRLLRSETTDGRVADTHVLPLDRTVGGALDPKW